MFQKTVIAHNNNWPLGKKFRITKKNLNHEDCRKRGFPKFLVTNESVTLTWSRSILTLNNMFKNAAFQRDGTAACSLQNTKEDSCINFVNVASTVTKLIFRLGKSSTSAKSQAEIMDNPTKQFERITTLFPNVQLIRFIDSPNQWGPIIKEIVVGKPDGTASRIAVENDQDYENRMPKTLQIDIENNSPPPLSHSRKVKTRSIVSKPVLFAVAMPPLIEAQQAERKIPEAQPEQRKIPEAQQEERKNPEAQQEQRKVPEAQQERKIPEVEEEQKNPQVEEERKNPDETEKNKVEQDTGEGEWSVSAQMMTVLCSVFLFICAVVALLTRTLIHKCSRDSSAQAVIAERKWYEARETANDELGHDIETSRSRSMSPK